ncbi:TonB-dependent receptor [Sphingomonas colocasiae]|nr:TonB-dependent receptor [Sphingomonas colocasiae]
MANLRNRLLAGMAFCACVTATPALAQDANEGTNEIIVTAQRREQTLQEVPLSLTVVGEQQLERQAALSLADYTKLVPGLNVQAQDAGIVRIVLRGANTGSVGSTVASYIDDMPFGSSGSLINAGTAAADFDPFDVARIEVLRGPQGTLYGSNSLGGVLKYVTNLPSTAAFEARAQTGVEAVAGGGTGFSGNAMINVPLGDTLAVRASGFYRERPGFIDSVGFNVKNANASKSYGGRASLLFAPTDNFSIRLQSVLQNIDGGTPSSFDIDPVSHKPYNAAAGGVQTGERTRFVLYPDGYDIRYRLFAGTLEWDFGGATLSSITSHSKQTYQSVTDASTNALRATINAFYAPTAPNTVGFVFVNNQQVKKFTQELRLASSDSETFEWTVGGYYTKEKTRLYQTYIPFQLSSRQLMPTRLTVGGVTFEDFVISYINASYEELAGFATGTLHLGDRFDITAGGRYSHNRQESEQAVIQLGVGSANTGKSSQGVFTWSVSPRFELSDHASVYARVAKGFRPGGPNLIPLGAPADFPSQFKADTIISYEAGLRAETADRSFTFDGSIFYLDWKNILIATTVNTPTGPVGVNGNGQKARSQGVELAVTARPTAGLTVMINGAYTDAKLLQDTVPASGGLNLTGGLKGDRLPYVPEFAATISVDYDWEISAGAKAYVGANVRLVSDQPGTFSAAYRAAYGRAPEIDGYKTVDLRAGVNFERFNLSVFANNLTNTYALSSLGSAFTAAPSAIGGSNVNYLTAAGIRPRTIGASVGVSF